MTGPDAPRLSPPTLPPLIAIEVGEDADGASFTEALITFAAEVASAIGAEVSDSRLAVLPPDELTSRRLRLSDSEVSAPRIVTWTSPRSHWRSVVVSGGSIGVLDLSGSRLDNVVFRGVRIGYANLREAQVSDVSFDGCRVGTLDLAGAQTTRVALTDCQADELDVRARKGDHLDLRGLAVVRLNRLEFAGGLAGVVLTPAQARELGPALAEDLGITLTEEEL